MKFLYRGFVLTAIDQDLDNYEAKELTDLLDPPRSIHDVRKFPLVTFTQIFIIVHTHACTQAHTQARTHKHIHT